MPRLLERLTAIGWPTRWPRSAAALGLAVGLVLLVACANVGNLLASDYFVESGSFARINNLTVGYTFPKSFLQRVKLSSFRVFVTSQNLFTYKKYSGFTAELPGDPTSSGIELSAYPTTRTIAAGLNIGF